MNRRNGIEQLLEKLGETPEEVASSLRTAQIQGLKEITEVFQV